MLRLSNRLVAAWVLALLAPLAMAQNQNAAPPEPAGMTQMFNGKDLTGWDGDTTLWSVKDGIIRGETTAEKKAKGNTFLIWQGGKPGDFDLRLSYRVAASNNSGIQYRSKHLVDHKDNKWVVQGYQAEVRDDNTMTGFVYDEKGKRARMCLAGEKAVWTEAGKKSIETFATNEALQKALKKGDWNEYAIIAKGSNIKHYINGVLFMDFTDEHPQLALKEGVIAVQIHGGAPMWVEFKDLRVKMAQ